MKLVQWDESLTTGIDEIDTQHKSLLSIMNKLFSEYTASNSMSDLTPAFQALELYADEHFKTEETLMQQYGYGKMSQHILEHQSFRIHLSDMKAYYSKNKEKSYSLIFNFLRNWLIKHIQCSDKDYIQFFREKGIAK